MCVCVCVGVAFFVFVGLRFYVFGFGFLFFIRSKQIPDDGFKSKFQTVQPSRFTSMYGKPGLRSQFNHPGGSHRAGRDHSRGKMLYKAFRARSPGHLIFLLNKAPAA